MNSGPKTLFDKQFEASQILLLDGDPRERAIKYCQMAELSPIKALKVINALRIGIPKLSDELVEIFVYGKIPFLYLKGKVSNFYKAHEALRKLVIYKRTKTISG